MIRSLFQLTFPGYMSRKFLIFFQLLFGFVGGSLPPDHNQSLKGSVFGTPPSSGDTPQRPISADVSLSLETLFAEFFSAGGRSALVAPSDRSATFLDLNLSRSAFVSYQTGCVPSLCLVLGLLHRPPLEEKCGEEERVRSFDQATGICTLPSGEIGQEKAIIKR